MINGVLPMRLSYAEQSQQSPFVVSSDDKEHFLVAAPILHHKSDVAMAAVVQAAATTVASTRVLVWLPLEEFADERVIDFPGLDQSTERLNVTMVVVGVVGG